MCDQAIEANFLDFLVRKRTGVKKTCLKPTLPLSHIPDNSLDLFLIHKFNQILKKVFMIADLLNN